MSRLDKERQARLEPERMRTCKDTLEEMGYEVHEYGGNMLEFKYKGNTIKFYPYSGWHSGKGIKDGRGFQNLIKQLEVEEEL